MSTHIVDPSAIIVALFEQFREMNPIYGNFEGRTLLDRIDNPFIRDRTLGMYFPVEVTCDNYGYENDGHTRRPELERHYRKFLHYIVLSGRRVYVAVSDAGRLEDVPVGLFENTSNHDSCWRQDGVQRKLFEVYIEAAHHCYNFDELPKHLRKPPIAAIAADVQGRMGRPLFADNLIQFVRVERGPYVDENHRYLDTIKSVKKVKFNFTITEE